MRLERHRAASEGTPDARRVSAPDVAAALRHMAAECQDVRLTCAIVHDPLGEHEQRPIFGEYYVFDSEGV